MPKYRLIEEFCGFEPENQRMVYSRDKIIAFNCNYGGSIEETQVELDVNHDMVTGEGIHPDVTNHQETYCFSTREVMEETTS